jgi:tryptophan synthase alpha subunit
MKQSAVEWLVNEIAEKYNFRFATYYGQEIQQAKEMEKQQGYSEEEVLELLQKALTHQDDGEIGSLVTVQGQIRTANFYSWFEQFKKK